MCETKFLIPYILCWSLTFALRKSWLSDFVKHFQVFFVSF